MGCCKSKKLIISDVGEYIIKLFDKNTNYNYKINLERAIKLYESEKYKLNGGDLDYKTKCIIVMSFIRDIDKIICNDKKILKMNDINKNDFINKYLININIPIFIIDELEKYRKNIDTHSLTLMKLYDSKEYISPDKCVTIYSIEKQIYIICNLINNIQSI
jgi:hypothetical protein